MVQSAGVLDSAGSGGYAILSVCNFGTNGPVRTQYIK
jgi:hypothetical protein